MSRILQIFSIILVLIWGYATAGAQTSESASNAILLEQLRQIESKRRLARQEIAQLEDRVEAEVDQVIGRLDSLFHSSQTQKRFKEHHAEAKEILQKVSLPDDVGSLKVFWEQWRSILSDFLPEFLSNSKDFNDMVGRFIRDGERHLEPAREALEGDIEELFEDVLGNEVERAQRDIRTPFQGILIRYFPVWEGHNLQAPPLPSLPQASGVEPGTFGLSEGLALTGLLLILLRKRIAKMIQRRVGVKILGKVAAKLIPGVGMLLIAHDVVHAKAELEAMLRTEFAAAYAEELTPATLWEMPPDSGTPSSRQEIEKDVRDLLKRWSQHCRQEVDRMLDAARIFTLSPNIQAYVALQEEQGRNSREVVEEMMLVGEVFEDHMIARTPVVRLLDMIIYAPDRQELSRLAQALDNRLLREYERHGREVLLAAHTLGVDLFLEAMDASAELDWAGAQRAFEQYPHDMSDPARRGLLLLLLEELDYAGVPPSTLERIVRHETVFHALLPVLLASDREKLFEILANDQVSRLVEKGYTLHPEVMDAFVETWPSRTWRRYERESRFQALFTLAAYRLEERHQAASALAEEISQRDELTPIYEEVGLDGVRLWDAYVTSSTGEHQRGLAKQAIDLYKAGYPRDDLSERGRLRLAAFYSRLPFDLTLYNLLKPLGKAVYLVAVLFAVFIVAAPLLIFLKVGRKFVWSRPKRGSEGGEASPADSRTKGPRSEKQEDAEKGRSSPATSDDDMIGRDEQNNQRPETPSA